jgi:hypothetical protein
MKIIINVKDYNIILFYIIIVVLCRLRTRETNKSKRKIIKKRLNTILNTLKRIIKIMQQHLPIWRCHTLNSKIIQRSSKLAVILYSKIRSFRKLITDFIRHIHKSQTKSIKYSSTHIFSWNIIRTQTRVRQEKLFK